ncbi:MAG TPA: N-acetylmuramoyl-L-alanine amidase, partial [Elusimicrobiales bacterium]|nr:N-acetylmuramoyl-L-alanine amidase [Elusimicrobiales bacterium]
LFNARHYTNWIVYDSSDTFVQDISWRQLDAETAGIKINFGKDASLWGYDIFYASGALNLELRQPPLLDCRRHLPLTGLTVVLDPGHSQKTIPPYDGAVGPAGSLEYAVNYLIAKELEQELTQKGAKVVMTRGETGEVPLQNRPLIAWAARGDLFISIHNNALPDGENPLLPSRGYSVYYYHPSSFEFAKLMLSSFSHKLPLPNENLRFGDLLVIRQTQMPSILVECAYLILPAQEMLLNSPEFRKKLATAMSAAVSAYAKTLPETRTCQAALSETLPAANRKQALKTAAQTAKQQIPPRKNRAGKPKR